MCVYLMKSEKSPDRVGCMYAEWICGWAPHACSAQRQQLSIIVLWKSCAIGMIGFVLCACRSHTMYTHGNAFGTNCAPMASIWLGKPIKHHRRLRHCTHSHFENVFYAHVCMCVILTVASFWSIDGSFVLSFRMLWKHTVFFLFSLTLIASFFPVLRSTIRFSFILSMGQISWMER